MTIDEANRQLLSTLNAVYDEREASSICALVMEKITGESKSLRVIHKQNEFSNDQESFFKNCLKELLGHRPVQYVLGEAWFAGLRFYVDEHVLIPRPETEELAAWVLADLETASSLKYKVLDIGTGSGCIPVSLGKKRNDLQLLACDVSVSALDIARKNSIDNGVAIDFFRCDILDNSSWDQIPDINIILSKPPYIPERQKAQLDKHVKNCEPGLALFVPDSDPIIFYKQIGLLAKKKLLPRGKVFLEVHHDFSKEVLKWYGENGFSTDLRKDFSGKNRMIRAVLY